MRALLIWPKFESFSFWNFEKVYETTGVKYMTPPLGLLTVAALLPSGWEIKLVDENVKALALEDIEWADIVLVSSKIVSRQRALSVIRWIKEVGKQVIVGGPDATLNENVYLDVGADILCLGEGELTIHRMLADMGRGETKEVYRAEGLADLTMTPPPRFDLVKFKDYLYIGLQYSRGCPYNCEFCNVIDIFKHYQTKQIDQVLRELDLLFEAGYRGQVDFFDDNLIGHMVTAKPLLEALAKWLKDHRYPFQFSTSVTLNIAKDDELLALIKKARFKNFLIGIESPSEEALKSAQKPQNTGFSIAEACDRIYRLGGATVHSGFLLGLDDEPDDIGEQIVKCIDETSVPWVMAGIVYPLPGTQLSRRLDAEGRLFPKARSFNDDTVRDQISAGLQFRPHRKPTDVINDLIRVLNHSFDPKNYFQRCADVAVRLGTIPVLIPGWRVFFRNLRTFFRLAFRMTVSKSTRKPFWKAFWRTVFKNRAGVEAVVTLAVLYQHFQAMLPYCNEQLERQKREIAELGEEQWLLENLKEPDEADCPVKPLNKEVARVEPAPAQIVELAS